MYPCHVCEELNFFKNSWYSITCSGGSTVGHAPIHEQQQRAQKDNAASPCIGRYIGRVLYLRGVFLLSAATYSLLHTVD